MHTASGAGSVLGLAIAAMALTGCVDQALAPPTSVDSSGLSPSAITATASPSPSFIRPTPNPSPTFLVHVVTAGESLTSIARQYGTTARSIAYWNRDRYPSLDPDSEGYDPNRIVVGWSLQLIPTEVVDESDLPDPTPGATPSGSPGTSSVPTGSDAPSAGASPS